MHPKRFTSTELKKRMKEAYEKRRQDVISGKETNFKICKKCNKVKHNDEYYTYKDKLTDWCIECFVDYFDDHYPALYEEYAMFIKNPNIYPKESRFLYGNGGNSHRSHGIKQPNYGFLNGYLTGICAICGTTLLFGEYHHILGDQSDITVMLCSECHDTDGITKTDYHCSQIGRKIEWGALNYLSVD